MAGAVQVWKPEPRKAPVKVSGGLWGALAKVSIAVGAVIGSGIFATTTAFVLPFVGAISVPVVVGVGTALTCFCLDLPALIADPQEVIEGKSIDFLGKTLDTYFRQLHERCSALSNRLEKLERLIVSGSAGVAAYGMTALHLLTP